MLAAGWPGPLQADTISTFGVSGTTISACLNVNDGSPLPPSQCTPTISGFAGTFQVDVTTGTPITLNLLGPGPFQFTTAPPGLPPFNIGVSPYQNGVSLFEPNGAFNGLILNITTPTPGSLVGYDGGTIIPYPSGPPDPFFDVGSEVNEAFHIPLYYILGGSITPTPEASSFTLILLGLGALIAMRERVKKLGRIHKPGLFY